MRTPHPSAPQPAVAETKPDPRGPASSLDDVPAWPADAVEVARVLGAWGIKGGIRVKAFAADPQALFSSKRWFVEPPERKSAPTPKTAAIALGALHRALPRLLRIVQAREQGDAIVATCQEIPDRSAAEAMAGARIFVSRASFPTPEVNEFYWVDLIGLAVHDRAGRVLGTVTTLIETGPHCVLSVQGADAASDPVLIPFVDAYVDRVDRQARTIHVDWDPDY